jgi:hypothetical protein
VVINCTRYLLSFFNPYVRIAVEILLLSFLFLLKPPMSFLARESERESVCVCVCVCVCDPSIFSPHFADKIYVNRLTLPDSSFRSIDVDISCSEVRIYPSRGHLSFVLFNFSIAILSILWLCEQLRGSNCRTVA